jgi:limonene 1,2-monooxygenase
MQITGKYGIGVLSIASTSSEGLQALPTQWGFAEEASAQHGQTVARANWRVLMSWHLAETREQARAEAVHGLHRWHNDYNVRVLGRPNATHVDDPWELLEQVTAAGASGGGAAVVGTPDDLIVAIRRLQQVTGGFGVVLGFAHDWASIEAQRRSWDMVARYVIPEINGTLRPMRASAEYVAEHKADLIAGASRAVAAKILAHEGAAAAMATTMAHLAAQQEQRQSEFRPGAGLPSA